MPEVSSNAPDDVRLWAGLDVHKLSIVAATLPPIGGQPGVQRIETTRPAVRRFIERLGGPEGPAVCYEAGPGRFDLLRVLSEFGVACDVVAPWLIALRAGDRVKTDRREAKKLVRRYRAGQLSYVQPPTPETEGLKGPDALPRGSPPRPDRRAPPGQQAAAQARPDLPRRPDCSGPRCTERGSPAKRLDDELAHAALRPMLIQLDGLDRQLDALDRDLEPIASSHRWAKTVEILSRFRGISTRTALGLIAERLRPLRSPPRAMRVAGDRPVRIPLRSATPPRAHHQDRQPPARRLLIEAAWAYQHRPCRPKRGPDPTRAPGKRRSGCTAATRISPHAASAPPSRPSRSPANSLASSGPPPPSSPSF
jgi:transposase